MAEIYSDSLQTSADNCRFSRFIMQKEKRQFNSGLVVFHSKVIDVDPFLYLMLGVSSIQTLYAMKNSYQNLNVLGIENAFCILTQFL